MFDFTLKSEMAYFSIKSPLSIRLKNEVLGTGIIMQQQKLTFLSIFCSLCMIFCV